MAADAGRSQATIHSWWYRDSIPGDVDVTLVKAAHIRGFSLTFEELAQARSDTAGGQSQ